MNKKLATVLAVVVIVAIGIWAIVPRGYDGPYNVLFISVDTLRPDHLTYHGYERETSPVIDKIAYEGITYTNCYSVSGWTLPSMATLLSGRYPRDHGATDFHWAMADDVPTLPSILKDHGYTTSAFVSHVILTPKYGLNRGFDKYDISVLDVGYPHNVATAEQLTDLVVADLDTLREPFFMWSHYFDPHYLYIWHEEWGDWGTTDLDRYDQEIAHTDRHIGRVIAALEKKGVMDRTIIVFTSDHGEEFGDHRGQYHYTLYDEVIRVPLVIWAPFIKPGIDDSVVEQTDLVPTLLGMLDIEPAPGLNLPGRNLLDSGEDNAPVFLERDRPPKASQRGIVHGRHKLVVVEGKDVKKLPEKSRKTSTIIKNVKPGIYMFDLVADPREENNIYIETDPRARRLMKALALHFSTEKAPVREVKIDESLTRKLRSLGYIR